MKSKRYLLILLEIGSRFCLVGTESDVSSALPTSFMPIRFDAEIGGPICDPHDYFGSVMVRV
jgi:hypothetical protein